MHLLNNLAVKVKVDPENRPQPRQSDGNLRMKASPGKRVGSDFQIYQEQEV